MYMVEELPRSLLQQATIKVAENSVVHLELSVSADAKFGLKRQLVRSDDVTRTQYLNIDQPSTLYDFATADPFEKKLLGHYEQMVGRCNTEQVAQGLSIEDPLGAIGDLGNCTDEFDLTATVGAIVHSLGGAQFVYHCLRFNAAGDVVNPLESSYLIGCRPGWIQEYLTNSWSLDDPYLCYAAKNLDPILTSTINRDRVNHWFSKSAREHAFVGGLIAPAHFARKGLVGMLHVGCAIGAGESDERLWMRRLLLQALSIAILSWMINKARDAGIAKYELNTRDVAALQAYLIRKSVSDVADVTGVTVRTVYQTLFRSINKKMGMDRIDASAEKALSEGLLD
jgi:hypothetical protein